MPSFKPGSNRSGKSAGKNYRLNQNFSVRRKIAKHEQATKRALYLSTLPKGRFKRLAYRMHPRRLAAYWFSREGAIMALKVTGVGIIICFFLIIGLFAYFRKDLPKIQGLAGSNLGGSITYYDRTGEVILWQDYNAVKRVPVEGNQISDYMRQATIAVEDKNFYEHGAFDASGIMRAAVHNVFGDGPLEGGSTITQQLVKLHQQWTNNRTITRKIKELILAIELERQYSKDEILTGYLNAAPYGGVLYGVEVAARDYFDVSAKNLTLAQSAFLAGIPQSPTYYSPYSSNKWNSAVSGTEGFGKEAILGRQHYILDLMAEQGYITQAQADKAKKVDILAQIHPLEPKYQGIKAPHFVLSAKQELEKKYGAQTINRGGWKVTTTVDLKLQNKAQELIRETMPTIESYGGDTAAFVAEDVKTGQIVALVGGPNFRNPEFGKINYARTPIPPGSSFKPYDYAALIQYADAGAGNVLYDIQQPLPGWPCTDKSDPRYDDAANCLWNYDFIYPGPMTLRYALGGSRNVPAVKANLTVGTEKVIDMAESMMMGAPDAGYGYNCFADVALTDTAPCYGSSAIGDGAYLHLDEHVNGLATMSRLGEYIPRTYIKKIVDGGDRTIYEWQQPRGKQVIDKDTAYIVTDMLSDPRASYIRGYQKFHHQPNGWHFAIKTGTTNNNFDGLMTSYSTKYAAVTWVGYHTRNKSLTAGHMEDMTSPIVRGWMEYAHQDLEANNWDMPDNVQTLPAYVRTSGFGTGAILPSPSQDLYPAEYEPQGSIGSAVIDKVSGKLATECTPELAKETVGGSANSFSVDKFVDGGISADRYSGQDDVHNCDDAPPTVTILPPGRCEDDCQITVTPFAGTHALSSDRFASNLIVQINSRTVATFHPTQSGEPYVFSYQPRGDGRVTVSATITDSVLYQSSDSVTMEIKYNGGGGSDGDEGNSEDGEVEGVTDDDPGRGRGPN